MKRCLFCGGKMFKRFYIMIDNCTDSDERQVDYVCHDCGSSISTYNGFPLFFDPLGLFVRVLSPLSA